MDAATNPGGAASETPHRPRLKAALIAPIYGPRPGYWPVDVEVTTGGVAVCFDRLILFRCILRARNA